MLTDKKIREIRSNVGARPKLVSQTRAVPGPSPPRFKTVFYLASDTE